MKYQIIQFSMIDCTRIAPNKVNTNMIKIKIKSFNKID